MPLSLLSRLFRPAIRPAGPRLGSVPDLESPPYRQFMADCNAFAARHGLRQFTNWTKVWEYPWLYFHGMDRIDWRGKHLVDLGSEISPLPWLLASRGARVTLIEVDPQWEPTWKKLRDELGADVRWHFVDSEILPVPTADAEAVTSFSVIEHQPDKGKALDEMARVLKPGAPMFISFDICEPDMGMTTSEWNPHAMTMAEFERDVWSHPAFRPGAKPQWNVADIPAFKTWHLQSAPHHNYVTGAAVMVRK